MNFRKWYVLAVFAALNSVSWADEQGENQALRLPLKEKHEIELLTDTDVPPGPVVVIQKRVFLSEARESGKCRGRGLFYFDFGQTELTRVGDFSDFNCVTALRTDGRNLFVVWETDNGRSRIQKISAQKPELVAPAQDEFAQRVSDVWYRTDIATENLRFPAVRRVTWNVGAEGALLFLRFLGDKGPKLLGARWVLEKNKFEGPFVVNAELPSNVDDPASLSAARTLKKLEMTEAVEVNGTVFAVLSDPSEEGELLGSILGLDLEHGKVTSRFGALSPTLPGEPWEALDSKDWWIRRPRFFAPAKEGFLIADRTDYAQELKTISYYSMKDKKHYWVAMHGNDVGGLFYLDEGMVVSQPKNRRVLWIGPKGNKPKLWEEKK